MPVLEQGDGGHPLKFTVKVGFDPAHAERSLAEFARRAEGAANTSPSSMR